MGRVLSSKIEKLSTVNLFMSKRDVFQWFSETKKWKTWKWYNYHWINCQRKIKGNNVEKNDIIGKNDYFMWYLITNHIVDTRDMFIIFCF